MPSARGEDNWRPGPEVERAHGFDMAFCGNANCGLHVIPMREDGSPICEMVMSADQTLRMINLCKHYLYEKAAQKDG